MEENLTITARELLAVYNNGRKKGFALGILATLAAQTAYKKYSNNVPTVTFKTNPS